MTAAKILTKMWELEDVSLKLTNEFGQIYFATRHGLPVALKIPNQDIANRSAWERSAGKALLHFSGFGAVRLLAEESLGYLMERVEPGKPLSNRVTDGQDDRATEIICEVAAELHKAGPGEGFPPLPEWPDSYDKYSLHDGDLRLPAKLYKRAKGLYLELALSQSRMTLLHGDLHHDNILSDHLRDWVAIDPKGWVGEPAYEFGCLLRNPGTDPRLFAKPEIISRRVSIITEHTGLDRQRILLWAFAQAVLSAIWSMEDNLDPARGLVTAKAIEPLL